MQVSDAAKLVVVNVLHCEFGVHFLVIILDAFKGIQELGGSETIYTANICTICIVMLAPALRIIDFGIFTGSAIINIASLGSIAGVHSVLFHQRLELINIHSAVISIPDFK